MASLTWFPPNVPLLARSSILPHSTTSTPFHRSVPLLVLSHLCFNTSASARTTSLTLPHPNILVSLVHSLRPPLRTSGLPQSLSSSRSGKMILVKVHPWNAPTSAHHPLQNRMPSHLYFNTSTSTRTTSPTLPHLNVLISLAHSPRPSPRTSRPPHSLSSSRSRKMSMSKVSLQNTLTLACHPLQNWVHHHPRLNTSTNARMTLPALPHPNALSLPTCSPRSYPLAQLLP